MKSKSTTASSKQEVEEAPDDVAAAVDATDAAAATASIDLDAILVEIGESGAHRRRSWLLWCAIVLCATLPYMSYVFTAGQLDYRCAVPQCEPLSADAVAADFGGAAWLPNAMPVAVDGRPAQCERYRWVGSAGSSGDVDDRSRSAECGEASSFNRTHLERCDRFVYDGDEVTIVKEFNITCEDSGWRLALIGTLTYSASCLLMPICAIISDRYGRRPILLVSLLLSGTCGLITSASVSYAMFAGMQFVTAMTTCGIYMTIFVLAIESSGPGQRVFIGSLLSAVYSFGQGMCGVLASQVPDFRVYLRLLFAPSFVALLLIWWVPESVRWLLAKGRVPEARRILERAARRNGVELSEKTLQRLAAPVRGQASLPETVELEMAAEKMLPNKLAATGDEVANDDRLPASATIGTQYAAALRSRTLILRLLNCIFTWWTNSFIYYGMNIHAVALSGSKYSNFILVNLVEVPAVFAAYWLMERFGRNRTLSACLALNGACCLVSEFLMPADSSWAVGRLALYMLGKCGVTVSFTVLYVYTSELFPTAMRQTFMNTCSTIGAFGSMIAPQTPLLATAWRALPMLLFGGTALTSAALVLWLPETLNTQLPDTVADAERIGAVVGERARPAGKSKSEGTSEVCSI